MSIFTWFEQLFRAAKARHALFLHGFECGAKNAISQKCLFFCRLRQPWVTKPRELKQNEKCVFAKLLVFQRSGSFMGVKSKEISTLEKCV